MKTGKLIPMDRPRRLLDKVRQYTSHSEYFFKDLSTAITLFLEALPNADTQLVHQMLPLLGCAGDDRVLWPLFNLMVTGSLDDGLRTSTAIHLGLAASLSQNPAPINTALIKKLSHPDAAIRSSSALALGWEGNRPAITPLAGRLSDPDHNVRASVVAALSSLADKEVLALLEERIKNGKKEEQRLIFLHLWRFDKHLSRVEDIYIDSMADVEPDLLLDLLAGLAMLPLSPRLIDRYRLFMADKNARIRHQVLQNLSAANPFEYSVLNKQLRKMLSDEDALVRQAAIKLFARNG